MSELERIDISLATERPSPEIRFLILEQHVSKIQEEITFLSTELEISKFVSFGISPKEIRRNPNGWFEFLLTIDWTSMISIMGAVSSSITLGSFLYKTLNYLRKRYRRKEVRRLRINCTTSVAVSINHLKSIGARISQNQIKLIYLSKLLAYYCIAIFAGPIINPQEIHVVTTHIDGEISNYSYVKL